MAIQDFFKLQNLFSPDDQEPLPSYQTVPNYSYGWDQPQSEASIMDAFKKSVLNPPERTRPSAMRMIGTGLLSALQGSTEPAAEAKGFWGSLANKPFNVAQAENILSMPYEKKLSDWQARNEPLYKGAQLESQSPERLARAQKAQAEAGVIGPREARLGRQGDIRLQQSQQRIEQNQQKIDHVLSRQDLTDSEKLALANKYRQEQIQLQGEIQSGQISQRGAITTGQINLRGEIQKDIQELRGQQELGQITARGEQARQTKETIPGKAPGSTKDMTPSQRKIQQQLKANQAVIEHPEWENYLSIDPNTDLVKVEKSGTNMFGRKTGPSPEERKKILDYLGIGEEEATPVAAPKKPAAKPEAKVTAPVATKPATPSGTVVVRDKQGRKYSLPANQLPAAIKQGYEQVK